MRGWFDAFRTDGGPTLYAYSNRTSVSGDAATIVIFLTFVTIYCAFLIIFPGIRKEKFSTFCTVTLSLLTGIIICVCSFSSEWDVGSGEIFSSYRAFSSHKIRANLGVSIGLDHANITLKVLPRNNKTLDIDFNERFQWRTPDDMTHRYQDSLKKGLPYPILTAAEYLTLDEEGFMWGRAYRQAGYYTGIVLWAAFACWILANILLLNVPRYGAYALTFTGLLMCFAAFLYWGLKPQKPLMMRFEETVITFRCGNCFWVTVIVGCLVMISGLVISTVDWIYPHKFSTILEVDFDTPYDRHTIIEDSHDTRKRRFKIPRLEEPLNVGRTVGSRLLRRLSNRGKEPKERVETNPGVDNAAFEMEPPQARSPPQWKSNLLKRTDSKLSDKSVAFGDPLPLSLSSHHVHNQQGLADAEQYLPSEIVPPSLARSDSRTSVCASLPALRSSADHPDAKTASPPHMTRQDSCLSCSSGSSYGLSLLSRSHSLAGDLAETTRPHPPVARLNSGNIIVFHRTDSRGQLQRLSGEVVEIQTDELAGEW